MELAVIYQRVIGLDDLELAVPVEIGYRGRRREIAAEIDRSHATRAGRPGRGGTVVAPDKVRGRGGWPPLARAQSLPDRCSSRSSRRSWPQNR